MVTACNITAMPLVRMMDATDCVEWRRIMIVRSITDVRYAWIGKMMRIMRLLQAVHNNYLNMPTNQFLTLHQNDDSAAPVGFVRDS